MSARPIALDAPPKFNARDELYTRLLDAPQEHAEALLAACDVLQGMHDRGLLELMRGLLGSGNEVLEVAVDAAKGPDAIRTIRNLLVLMNLVGSIDPENLGVVARAIPPVVEAVAQRPKPQGLWRLAVGSLWDRDVRFALTGLQSVLKTVGQSMRSTSK